jgi:hypothetical protein
LLNLSLVLNRLLRLPLLLHFQLLLLLLLLPPLLLPHSVLLLHLSHQSTYLLLLLQLP